MVAMTMFPNESRKTWVALALIGCAAGLQLVAGAAESGTHGKWANQAATLLIVISLLLGSPTGSLNRNLGQIHRDIASGRQARSTRLQMICSVLAIALMAVQTYQWWHAR